MHPVVRRLLAENAAVADELKTVVSAQAQTKAHENNSARSVNPSDHCRT